MATKAGSLRVVIGGSGHERTSRVRVRRGPLGRLTALLEAARIRRGLGDSRSMAELGRATGARC